MARIVEKARANGAVDIREARTAADRDNLWRARRSTHSVFARLAPNCIVEDATVPVSRVPEMIRGIREIAHKHRLLMGILAHAGDGNMHPLIATDIRDKGEWRRVEAAIGEIFELSVSLGGTLSGEHGIGIAKQAFLPMVRNEATRNFMATIKAAVDPFNLLNPGKSI
jgi:glycolate oxidase